MDSSEITANNFFTKFRRSHRNSSIRKTVLTNFTKFTGKELCQNLFLNKVKKKTLAHVFSCEFCKFLIKLYF